MNTPTGREGFMNTYFTEVLACESARMADVTDGETFACWRQHVVEELTNPHSPYALALQQSVALSERAEFLDQWQEIIAKTVGRMLQSSDSHDAPRFPTLATDANVDAQRTAVLILAALHGGSTLSRLARDSQPLHAALDLALAPLLTSRTAGAQGP